MARTESTKRTCTKCGKEHLRNSNWCYSCGYPNKEKLAAAKAAKIAKERAVKAEARDLDQAVLVAGRKRLFLDELLRNGGHVEKACRAAGVTRWTIGSYRDDDPEFGAQWENIQEYNVERLESEVDRRALGWEEEIVFQGRKTGETVTRYSDTLLMFRLKALRPERYREGPGVKQGSGLSEAELDEALTKMMARRARTAKAAVESLDTDLTM